MARLLVHVEGQTEEDFVNNILRDHLLAKGYETVGARIVGNVRQRDQRGGIRPWHSVRKDIVSQLREDSGCIATTMVDYYGLPRQGKSAWPGRATTPPGLSSEEKAQRIESALLSDVATEMGSRFDPRRFVPFVVMHEFEGLLFSDCGAFSRGIGFGSSQSEFAKIR